MVKTKRHQSNKKTRKNYKRIKPRYFQKGGSLPEASVVEVNLENGICPKDRCLNGPKNKKGGNPKVDDYYIGPSWGNLVVSNFKITDKNIADFKRLFGNECMYDCVVSAMQIIGILDFYTANLIRITKIGKEYGITNHEIEKIFTLIFNKRYVLQETNKANEFGEYVKSHLHPGHCIFCGIKRGDGTGHVLLIGRDLSGRLIKLDPQSTNPFCYLEEDKDCYNEFITNTTTYYLLFNYQNCLTQEEQLRMGFIGPNEVANCCLPCNKYDYEDADEDL